MLALLAQTSRPPDAFFALFGVLWCGMFALGLTQVVMAIIALIQVLKRDARAETKILWAAVAWFIPVVGPILWWTIGTKQVGTPKDPSSRRQDW